MDRVRLGDITEDDAAAEGAGSVEEFVRIWKAIHGAWDPEEEVWRIKFELVGVKS